MRLICEKKECLVNEDIIKYEGKETIVLAKEFSIYNLGESDVKIEFIGKNNGVLILEPGEGFDTKNDIRHAVVRTEGAIVKYSYWK